MRIDCDCCEMRGLACSDCVVSVILGADGPELGQEEQRAIDVLADAGMVPPLRLLVDDEPRQIPPKKSEKTPRRDLRAARSAG
jgi:hypothetical protein